VDARFERFGGHRNGGQWIVDFVGDTGRQKADAGHLLAADDFLRPLANLVVQIAADLLKAARHVVERASQFGELVVRFQEDSMIEIVLLGDAAGAFQQHVQGRDDPDIKQSE
jgi:hypothetical protein